MSCCHYYGAQINLSLCCTLVGEIIFPQLLQDVMCGDVARKLMTHINLAADYKVYSVFRVSYHKQARFVPFIGGFVENERFFMEPLDVGVFHLQYLDLSSASPKSSLVVSLFVNFEL